MYLYIILMNCTVLNDVAVGGSCVMNYVFILCHHNELTARVIPLEGFIEPIVQIPCFLCVNVLY